MATKSKKEKTGESAAIDWPFGTKNYILFGIALVIIIVGYICLGYGDDPNHPITLTVAPILLVLGYLVIPFAIMAKGKAEPEVTEDEAEAEE